MSPKSIYVDFELGVVRRPEDNMAGALVGEQIGLMFWRAVAEKDFEA